MKLDLSKLQDVRHLNGGKTTARCPACAADGGDAKGEHLVIYADGKFGCVVHPKDKAHNKAILKLAGSYDRGDGGYGCRLTVRPVQVQESRVLMKVGRLGRVKPSPEKKRVEPRGSSPAVAAPPTEVDQAEHTTHPHEVSVEPQLSPEVIEAELREFLDLPALVA